MKKKWSIILGSTALIFVLILAGSIYAESEDSKVTGGTIQIKNQGEADYPALAKISLEQATQKALAAVKGKVLKAELENENGFLVYGFEVVKIDKSIMDVKVDAGSGKILAMESDNVDTDDHDSDREKSEREDHHGKRDNDLEEDD